MAPPPVFFVLDAKAEVDRTAGRDSLGLSMIVITFAVSQESRALVARVRNPMRRGKMVRGQLAGREVAIVHTGIGAGAVESVLGPARAELRPAWVLSSGFAGGLDPGLPAGELLAAENYSAADWLKRVPAGVHRGTILTCAAPLDTPAAKAQVAGAAQAVDLESAAVARLCAVRGIPLLVLRIISDAADVALPLPSPVAYDFDRQRIRHLAICAYLATHPGRIPALIRFTRRLPGWQRALAEVIEAVVEQ